jgi:FkbM family methyltransferase
MWFVRRAVGVASRRLGRPELLAAVDPRALQAQREAIGISAVLASTLRSDGAYVDVGANRGQVLREAVRVAPSASHVAFEPIPALAAELARSFPGVDCRALALGAAPDVAQFCYFTGLDGWSGLRRSPHVSDAQGKPEYITVEVSTLDREIAQPPRVVKIDVEGAELAVLEGMTATLERHQPAVICEVHGTHEAFAAFMRARGYRVVNLEGVLPIERDPRSEHALALPPLDPGD